jgi:hypothetical protein
MVWRPAEAAFKWEEMLQARSALIQFWRNEGKSYGEIARLVSADAAQVKSIHENMLHWHKPEQQKFLDDTEAKQKEQANDHELIKRTEGWLAENPLSTNQITRPIVEDLLTALKGLDTQNQAEMNINDIR